MPVAVVAAAAYSFSAAAAVIGTATGLAAVAAGATMVGSALTIVGTITGNQKLTKIGGIIGLAGIATTGLTKLADAASAAGTAADVGAAAAGEVAGDVAAAAGEAAGGAVTGAVDLSGTIATPLDAAASAAPAAAQPTSLMSAAQGATGATDLSGTIATPGGQAAASAGDLTKITADAPFKADAASAFKAAAPDQLSAFNPNNVIDKAILDPNTGMPGLMGTAQAVSPTDIVARALGPNGEPGFLTKAGQWIKENKELAKMGADFAGGLFPSQKDQALTDYYKTQSDAAKRKALWATGRMA